MADSDRRTGGRGRGTEMRMAPIADLACAPLSSRAARSLGEASRGVPVQIGLPEAARRPRCAHRRPGPWPSLAPRLCSFAYGPLDASSAMRAISMHDLPCWQIGHPPSAPGPPPSSVFVVLGVRLINVCVKQRHRRRPCPCPLRHAAELAAELAAWRPPFGAPPRARTPRLARCFLPSAYVDHHLWRAQQKRGARCWGREVHRAIPLN